MSYIVVYQRADGSSGLEECTSLDLAVVAAERLRNVDAVENPRIFKTEEVKFDFRPYYRVEVSTDDRSTALDEATPVEAAPAPVAEMPAPEQVAPDLPPPPTEPAEQAPPPPVAQSDNAAEGAPASADADSATIDPWAAAEGSTIDYSLDADATDAAPAADEAPAEAADAAPAADAATAEVEAEDMGSSARGLFSTSSLPDPPADAADAAQLADDVSEAVPPRRGLFGR